MSLSKRSYESGFVGEIKCRLPILEIGVRFTRNYGHQKNLQGTWEIVNNTSAPSYMCRKVLKNGNLSKSDSLNNYRRFSEFDIYQAQGYDLKNI